MRCVVEFSLQLLTRAAHPIGLRFVGIFGIGIAALNHETRNDAMKDRSVVKAGLGQFNEVFDVLGSLVGEKGDFHVAELRLNDGFRSRSRSVTRGEQGGCPEEPRSAQDQTDCNTDDRPSLHHFLLLSQIDSSRGFIIPRLNGHQDRARCNACFAADCSASFLLRPVPLPTTSPLTVTSTSKSLS